MTSVAQALAIEGTASLEQLRYHNTTTLDEETVTRNNEQVQQQTSENRPVARQQQQQQQQQQQENVVEQQQSFKCISDHPGSNPSSSNLNHPLNRISPDLPFEHAQTVASQPPQFDQATTAHPLDDYYGRRQWFSPQHPPQTSTQHSFPAEVSWNGYYVHQEHGFQHHNNIYQPFLPNNNADQNDYSHRRVVEHSFCPIQRQPPKKSVALPRPVLASRVHSEESTADNVEMGNFVVLQSQYPPSHASHHQMPGRYPVPPLYDASRINPGFSSDTRQPTHPHGPHGGCQQWNFNYSQYYPEQQSYAHNARPAPRSQQGRDTVIERFTQQLEAKDEIIASLQRKLKDLEHEVQELRWLPMGKISQIPIADMVKIMEVYGSETSMQKFHQRKQPIQRASIVRQFRRWNPEFFRYFCHVQGEWVPKLGKEKELQRRAERRQDLAAQRAPTNGPSLSTPLSEASEAVNGDN